MAAELSQTNADGKENKAVDFSYANAVLSKNDCNKENINSDVAVNSQNNDEKSRGEVSELDGLPHCNNLNEQDDDFIDYNGYKRKKKLAKLKKQQATMRNTGDNNTSMRTHYFSKYEKLKEKRYKSLASSTSVSVSDDSEVVDSTEQVKYVEAPVPAVNPWTQNKNTTSVIKGENTVTSVDKCHSHSKVSVDEPSSSQPQNRIKGTSSVSYAHSNIQTRKDNGLNDVENWPTLATTLPSEKKLNRQRSVSISSDNQVAQKDSPKILNNQSSIESNSSGSTDNTEKYISPMTKSNVKLPNESVLKDSAKYEDSTDDHHQSNIDSKEITDATCSNQNTKVVSCDEKVNKMFALPSSKSSLGTHSGNPAKSIPHFEKNINLFKVNYNQRYDNGNNISETKKIIGYSKTKYKRTNKRNFKMDKRNSLDDTVNNKDDQKLNHRDEIEDPSSHSSSATSSTERQKKIPKNKWKRLEIETTPLRMEKRNFRYSARHKNGAQNKGKLNTDNGLQDQDGYHESTKYKNGSFTRNSRSITKTDYNVRGRSRQSAETDKEQQEYNDYPYNYQIHPYLANGNMMASNDMMLSFMGMYYYPTLPNYGEVNEAMVTEYVKKQIEYYFSEENLVKDLFLRRKMDAEGYIPVTLIASFHRIRSLTSDLNKVLHAIKQSENLELSQGFKVRTKYAPLKWPVPDTGVTTNFPSVMTFPSHPLGPLPPSVVNHMVVPTAPLPSIPPPPVPVRFRYFNSNNTVTDKSGVTASDNEDVKLVDRQRVTLDSQDETSENQDTTLENRDVTLDNQGIISDIKDVAIDANQDISVDKQAVLSDNKDIISSDQIVTSDSKDIISNDQVVTSGSKDIISNDQVITFDNNQDQVVESDKKYTTLDNEDVILYGQNITLDNQGTMASLHHDNLNPDVAEFVPVLNGIEENTVINGEVDECAEVLEDLNIKNDVEIISNNAADVNESSTKSELKSSGSIYWHEDVEDCSEHYYNEGQDEMESWKEVKRRSKFNRDRKESFQESSVFHNKCGLRSTPSVEKEALDFQFDEDLDMMLMVKQNTFSPWGADDESDYDELSDNEINKLLIVTQSPHVKHAKHEGHDRTGDWQTRVKMSQDLEYAIDVGLQIYEDNLWSQQEWVQSPNSYRTINVITPEMFEKMTSPIPRAKNPDFPPPPPSPSSDYLVRDYIQDDVFEMNDNDENVDPAEVLEVESVEQGQMVTMVINSNE